MRLGIAVLAAGLAAVPPFSYAQGADIGKQEYLSKCASCHGKDAKGDGPVADSLRQKVPDLTVLTKNSGGVFPFARIYDVIDGRKPVAVHGWREMPVWGSNYREERAELLRENTTPEELNSFAHGRIIALVGYIYTLQAK